MRRWALVHNGIVARIVEAAERPFHSSQTVVDVTGTPAQAGYTSDAYGNMRPTPAADALHAMDSKRSMLRSEGEHQALRGVWVDSPDGKVLFDTSHEGLARLAALAEGGSDHTPAADGTLAPVASKTVFAAAGKFLAKCFAHEAEMRSKLQDDAETDLFADWPDNDEPDDADKADADVKPMPLPVAPEAETTLLPAATEVALPATRADGSAVANGPVHDPAGETGAAHAE